MLKFYPFLHHYKLVTVALRWVNFICTWWINSIDYQQLSDWEDFYNNRRLHWGLKLKTPRQVYLEYANKIESVRERAS